MKVYLDLVMILNFSIDFLLLLCVSILLKRNASIKKIMLGAFAGGISILFLFFNINNIVLFILKLFISLLMILISFNYRNLKYTLTNLFYLYIVGIVLGGALYFLNIQFSYKHSGIVFYSNGVSINFIFIILTSPIILYIYTKQSKMLRYTYSNYYNVKLFLNNTSYDYVGYLDSGNVLTDNITNKPVILIDKRKLLFDIKEFRIIPFMCVNGTSTLKVVKIDKLLFNNKEYNNVLLGIMDKISFDGVDILLNRKLLEE